MLAPAHRPINLAIVGVGNCASSLVQGLAYYADGRNDLTGLRQWEIGGYRPTDIRIAATRHAVSGSEAGAIPLAGSGTHPRFRGVQAGRAFPALRVAAVRIAALPPALQAVRTVPLLFVRAGERRAGGGRCLVRGAARAAIGHLHSPPLRARRLRSQARDRIGLGSMAAADRRRRRFGQAE